MRGATRELDQALPPRRADALRPIAIGRGKEVFVSQVGRRRRIAIVVAAITSFAARLTRRVWRSEVRFITWMCLGKATLCELIELAQAILSMLRRSGMVPLGGR
jgi:hypothetical protein